MPAYITGNVAANLIGRLVASGIADAFGLPESFLLLVALNLAGAAIARGYIGATSGASPQRAAPQRPVMAIWRTHLGNPRLAPAFAIGFAILFVFVPDRYTADEAQEVGQ